MTVPAAGGPEVGGEDLRIAYDTSPCGLATVRLADGVLVAANDTVLRWLGRSRQTTVGTAVVTDLLAVGAGIYWETHLYPLLLVEGRLEEVALELRTPSGRLPVLVSAEVHHRSGTEAGVARLALVGTRERRRYERELLSARRHAEASEARARTLATATTALVEADGPTGIATALLEQLAVGLDASAGTVWVLDQPGTALREQVSRNEVGRPAPDPSGAGVYHGDGRWLVPLSAQDGPQGWVSVALDREDPDGRDAEMLAAICQQAGLALQRARQLEHSQSVALALQRSLLATAVPADPRFGVASVYRPGVEALEVGGDWYDTFLLADGLLGIVVGDVVGRGLAAASAMGQLRSAVRAIAGPGVGPAALLHRLDSFVEQVEATSMATLAYAELDLVTGVLRYACAGHPPPLLLPAAGEAELLWGGRSTPLGAFGRPSPRGEAELVLAPGDRLLLCTDGLVERRDRGLDEGLELLRLSAAAQRGGLAETVEALTTAMLRDEKHRDDVCVLLLGWSGDGFTATVPADLRLLPALRARLRSWLVTAGADGATADDLVLAASEALGNAAEHGHGLDDAASVEVRGELVGEDVVLEVRDAGRWRSPVASPERGRGTMVMRALVDEVTYETGYGTRVRLRRRLGGRP